MGNFNEILRQLRKSRQLTQLELANALQISRSTIGMYEKGSREPDFDTLEIIADYFNVDIDYLLGRSTKTTFLPKTEVQKNHVPETIAAHFEGKEFSDDDIKAINDFIEFVKSKNNK